MSTGCSSPLTGSATLSTGTGALLAGALTEFNLWIATTNKMASNKALIGSIKQTTHIKTIKTTLTTLFFKRANTLTGTRGVTIISNTNNPITP